MIEETLVQEVTADYLQNQLHWDESVLGMYEKLSKEGDLGQLSEQEVVLTRIRAAYEQNLADYKDTVPQLFYRNAFII